VLKLQQLRQFVIAASGGSLKAAAAGTFRSQAAVSIAMRELEKQIGAQLLEPNRRGKFTPLAQLLLPRFQELLAVHDRVLADARQLAQGEQGSISIAIPPFLAEQWLPEILSRFAEMNPRIRIRTIEDRSSRIRGLVADGTVSIGVAGLLAAEDEKLHVRRVAIDHYGVLCSSGHPFARRKSVSWPSIRGQRLIGSDALEVLAAAGLAHLNPPDLIVTSRAPLISCVRKNLGITILPMLTRPDPAKDLAFVPLVRPRLSRVLAILTRGPESLLPAGAKLEQMLFASLRDFAAAKGAAPV
jgi:DNA-binding transcriptional LysR family regulator